MTNGAAGAPSPAALHPIFNEAVIVNHRALRREFTRDELATAAEKLLADRIAGHPEAVERKRLTREQARQRERCARAIAETMRAVADRRDPGDPDKTWFDTAGAEGAGWWEVRADLANIFEAARAAALAPGANPHLEVRALKMAALASWFEPAFERGHTPAILLSFHVEQHFARRREEKAKAGPAPLPPRRQRVGALL
ncbi:hypothetical protein [Sphingomonas koreensis]